MSRRPLVKLVLAYVVMAAICVASLPSTSFAVTPNSPEVQAVLEKAITFLETNTRADSNAQKLGGVSLAAMAILKHRQNQPEYRDNKQALVESHPYIQRAIAACVATAQNPGAAQSNEFNYSLGIAILFMCEVDEAVGKKYENEIRTLLKMMADRQRQDGAWSYPEHPTGDTSQTQYGALSAWRAMLQGYEIDMSAVDEYCNWLIRIQDPSGQFPYQGQDPGNYNRIQQPDKQAKPDAAYRMYPAALGALYIAARLRNIPMTPSTEEQIFEKVGEAGTGPTTIKVDALRQALRDANRDYDATFKIDVRNYYQYYYLYSVERYFTLRYDAETPDQEPLEPSWYNEGFQYLQENQAENGSWADQTGAVTSTAFGALFLMRATRQILDLQGVVRGGFGLPDNLANVREVDGQVVSNEAVGDLNTLLQLIGDSAALEETTVTSAIDSVTFGGERKPEPSQVEELKKLISGQDAGRNYVARMAAVRALANAGDITHAPVLIYALGDPDHRVVHEAYDGLRLLSKRLSIISLPEQPSDEQKLAAQRAWEQWLKSVRPDLVVPEDAFLTPEEIQRRAAAGAQSAN